MGFDLRLSGGNAPEAVYDFGSALAWTEFADWVGTLPTEFTALHAFAKDSRVKGTMDLSVELDTALGLHPPGEGAKATAERLLELLDDGDDDETVTVGDDA